MLAGLPGEVCLQKEYHFYKINFLTTNICKQRVAFAQSELIRYAFRSY